ncbi:MAG: arsenate reductase (azurin) small subunit [Gammaproteobacteria bacterium]|nr:arsenate reductase (azurin) small subunit [Gammaproteobacteria bacterium]
MMTRRSFLMSSGAATAVSTVGVSLFPGAANAAKSMAEVVGYSRKKIAKLSDLKDNQPFDFNYPDGVRNNQCMIVKMGGAQAGGGVGKQKDIVAFSYLCTHQGGPLQGSYKVAGDQRVMGQCPFHLSTFDLRRHGIIVSGQAYESLPQVLIEIDGDNLYAVGMLGLVFGRSTNLKS